MKYDVTIINGDKELNPLNDNVDVEIRLNDGKIYSATFFTIENIKSLLKNYQLTGECVNGAYMWAADMIIVNILSEEVIRKSIDDLINKNELNQACTKIKG